MAFVLLEPSNTEKGVLIFKHLEIQFLNKLSSSLLNEVRKKYTLGMYFGSFYKLNKDLDYIDFYLATDNVIEINNSTKPRIPLNGFNFIDESLFHSEIKTEKKYDFLFVGTSITLKNLTKFLKGLTELYEQRNDFKVCIILRTTSTIEGLLYVRKIRKTLNNMPIELRKSIVYMELPTKANALPKDLMNNIYKQSRSLVIPSSLEGAARVVGEAAINNLSVISYSKMKGGTNNYLNLEMDYLFDDFSQLPDKLGKLLDRRVELEKYIAPNKSNYMESCSRIELCNYLENIVNLDSIDIYKKIKDRNLYNAFSSHLNELPEYFSNDKTDEIYSFNKMNKFLTYLATGNTPSDIFIYKTMDSILKLKKLINIPKAIIKLALRT